MRILILDDAREDLVAITNAIRDHEVEIRRADSVEPAERSDEVLNPGHSGFGVDGTVIALDDLDRPAVGIFDDHAASPRADLVFANQP